MSLPQEGRNRVVLERVSPEIDGGRFPIRRSVGERVDVQVDAYADSHDEISVVLLYRPVDQTEWSQVRMTRLVNDRWQASFEVTRLVDYVYTVQGWIDPFRSWRRDLVKRLDAAQPMQVDAQIGLQYLEAAAQKARDSDLQLIQQSLQKGRSFDAVNLRALCTDEALLAAVDRSLVPAYPTSYSRELSIAVDRERARFSSWYEMFPRSASAEPDRHGTLQDVIQRLPYVAEMGFDVLYLPPIHPIGRSYRKGRNNAVSAESGDVGSPWAIGASEGGHKAILPELGTFGDFDELVTAAKGMGIDIALDIAFQCAPDHPYVKQHPEWFRARPDGTIQYAENPPKKYQDIYPINFESSDWKGLWQELKSVFEFWMDRGVRIFRVDNPHTKSFAFWEWCLGDLRKKCPDAIFLAEAFTRPKVMYRLAKGGFNQSYTYFAWRQTRHELTEYLTELTRTEVVEYFRPNFWPNTPDILTEELQQGGRPAFVRRLILAATMTSNYGIYGPPFEHGWCVPVRHGSEEYVNSEKYQVHHHDIDRADSLRTLIGRVNRIRRENPALQQMRTLEFHPVSNEQLICYSKRDRDGQNVIVVVVNLDSGYTQSGFVELPLQELGIEQDEPYQMHDLLTDNRFMWYGDRNYVELDPHRLPAHVFRIRRKVRSESDREYFQ